MPSDQAGRTARHTRRLPRLGGEEGTALVEFALILPILALLLFAMLDFGKAFNYWNDETHLAAEGARWAVVDSNPGGSQSLQEWIQQQADSAELRSLATVCVSFPTNPDTGSSGQVGDPVTVTLTSNYNWLPFVSSQLGLASISIKGSATMRLEALPTNYSAGSGGTGSCT
jgi:Flp pilus assembly protein TadG